MREQHAESVIAPARMAAPLPGVQMLRALWQYRGFIAGMVRREFQVRYLNSLFGSVWAFVAPLAMIIIYTVVFSQVMRARLPGGDDRLAYGLYLCAGLLPWNFFTELLLRAETLFVDNANLLKKMSFPRSTLPVILLLSTSINFAIAFGIFLVVLACTHHFPGWVIFAFVPLLALQQAFALGIGVLMGTLHVFYRDVAQLTSVFFQFWFWCTPIVYSLAIVSQPMRGWFAWNPMTPLVAAYQRIIIGGQWPAWGDFQLHIAGGILAVAAALFATAKLSGEIVDEL